MTPKKKPCTKIVEWVIYMFLKFSIVLLIGLFSLASILLQPLLAPFN